MSEIKIDKEILSKNNPLPLAFIGDAVHTLYVREEILKSYKGKMNNYHSLASKECKASAQAENLNSIMPFLTEDELELVKRARNCKPKHSAKNASSADYSHATAFEALIGWLYVSGQENRLKELLTLARRKG